MLINVQKQYIIIGNTEEINYQEYIKDYTKF
jgi:hypothetical protein